MAPVLRAATVRERLVVTPVQPLAYARGSFFHSPLRARLVGRGRGSFVADGFGGVGGGGAAGGTPAAEKRGGGKQQHGGGEAERIARRDAVHQGAEPLRGCQRAAYAQHDAGGR